MLAESYFSLPVTGLRIQWPDKVDAEQLIF